MDRARIVSLVLGLATIVVMVLVGFATKEKWIDAALGLSLLGALGFFLMTIRSWMKEPYPRSPSCKPGKFTKVDEASGQEWESTDGGVTWTLVPSKQNTTVPGVLLLIAVGSVLAATPCAVCSCSADKPIVKANPVAADCVANKGILERECVLNGKTEVDVDTCIANIRLTHSCTDGGK